MPNPNQVEFPAIDLTQWLVGPYDLPNKPQDEILAPWQVPYYEAAYKGLQRVLGQEEVDGSQVPSPADAAGLFRDLESKRALHGMTRSLDYFLWDCENGVLEHELRPHQLRAVRNTVTMLQDPNVRHKRGLIKLPTGMGKTAIATALIVGVQYKRPVSGVTFDFVTPRTDLMLQTLGEDGRRGIGRFGSHLDVGVYYGGKKQAGKPGRIWVNESYRAAVERREVQPGERNVTVVDEVHMAQGEKMASALMTTLGPQESTADVIGIGMSATPVGATELFPYPIIDIKLRDAIKDGHLAPVKASTVQSNVHLTETSEPVDHGDFGEPQLADLIYNKARNQLIVDETLELIAKGKPTIVRCIPGGNLAHARLIEGHLNNSRVEVTDAQGRTYTRRVVALTIDGNMPLKERQAAYALLEKGTIHALTFVDVLSVGWDYPKTKGVVNGCPTLSISKMEQVLGRIMRPWEDENGEQVVAEAVDIVDDAESGVVTFADVLRQDDYLYVEGMIAGQQDAEIEIVAAQLKEQQKQAEAEARINRDIFESEGEFFIRVTEDMALALGITPTQLQSRIAYLPADQKKKFSPGKGKPVNAISQAAIDSIAQKLINKKQPLSK